MDAGAYLYDKGESRLNSQVEERTQERRSATLGGQLDERSGLKSEEPSVKKPITYFGVEYSSVLLSEDIVKNIQAHNRKAYTVNTAQIMYETTDEIERLLKQMRRIDDFALRILYRMKEFVRRIQCLSHQTLNLYSVLKEHYGLNKDDFPPPKITRDDAYLTELEPRDIERLNEPKQVEDIPMQAEDEKSKMKASRSESGLIMYEIENRVPMPRTKLAGNILRKNTALKQKTSEAMAKLLNCIEDPINKHVFQEVFEVVGSADQELVPQDHGQGPKLECCAREYQGRQRQGQ